MDETVRPARSAHALPALAVIVCAVFFALPAGRASAAYAMPVYSLTPAGGSTLGLKPSEGKTDVLMTSEDASYYNLIAGMTLEVASANVIGNDGTLSNDYNVDYDFMQMGDSGTNSYKGAIHNFRFETAGTYYFQFSAYNVYSQFLVSPVYSFNYDPNAGGLDLTMNRAQAFSYMQYMVKMNTKHTAAHLNAACVSVNYRSQSCYSHFNAGGKKYQGKFVFEHVDQGDGQLYFNGRFKGEAARFSCIRRSGRAACAKTVRWHT